MHRSQYTAVDMACWDASREGWAYCLSARDPTNVPKIIDDANPPMNSLPICPRSKP